MPYYAPIKRIRDKEERKRVIDKLLALRKKLQKDIPAKTARDTLLLATWNIREFKDNRRTESYYYIAEIIDSFDFVAVQEVSSSLEGLKRLMYYLGEFWDYIVTDATEGSAGGGERMAFLYDTRKIKFRHIAGEIVLPEDQQISMRMQFARTPFLAAFQAGWFKFMICTVHIYYGDDSPTSEGMKRRVAEINAAAKWFKKKAENEDANYILLGDFNIIDTTHMTMKALENNGFYIPENLKTKPTDLGETKHYDQIAFQVRDEDMLIFNKNHEEDKAGAFRFQEVVYKENEMNIYKPYFPARTIEGKNEEELKRYYNIYWRTFEMSDHLPMWVELKIDFSDEYLEKIPTE